MSVKVIRIESVEYPVSIVGNAGDVQKALVLRGQDENVFTTTKTALVNVTKLSSSMRVLTFATTDEQVVRSILAEELAKDDGYINLFSQSSGKGGTYYLCDAATVSEFFAGFTGEEIAVYGGLLFSDLATTRAEDGSLFAEVILTDEATYQDAGEKDGNSRFPRTHWQGTQQFRSLSLDDNGNLIALGKGVAFGYTKASSFELNDSQVKLGFSDVAPAWTIIAATPVKNGRCDRQWCSWELLTQMRPTEDAVTSAVGSTMESVAASLSLLQPENRGRFLKRFGVMKYDANGTLQAPKRAVLDALLSNMPMSSQLFNKLGKFMVGELIDTALSAGVHVRRHLLQISDALGVAEVEAADARFVAYGLPINHAGQVTLHSRAPKGMFSRATADRQTRDADGDGSLSTSESFIVRAFANGDTWPLVVPSKNKGGKTPTARTRAAFIEKSIQVLKDGQWVGFLTEAQLNAMYEVELATNEASRAYWLKLAGELAGLAMDAPVLLKRSVKGFHAAAKSALSQASGCRKPAWREMSKLARLDATNIYQLADPAYVIVNPVSINDHAWNAMIDTARTWAAANPMSNLDMVEVAELMQVEHPNFIPQPVNRYNAKKLVSMWGGYWSSVHGKEDVDHSGFWVAFRARCQALSLADVAAVLFWMPKADSKSDGFNLKWHAVWNSSHSWVDLLGMHPTAINEIGIKFPTSVVVEALVI